MMLWVTQKIIEQRQRRTGGPEEEERGGSSRSTQAESEATAPSPRPCAHVRERLARGACLSPTVMSRIDTDTA